MEQPDAQMQGCHDTSVGTRQHLIGSAAPQHACSYAARNLPCNPCRDWNLYSCRRERCTYCHVPASRRRTRPARTAEEEQQLLQDLLPEEKFRAFAFYNDLVGRLLKGKGRAALQASLRQAYMQSLSIVSTRPYGVVAEFAPSIRRIKDLIDDLEEFMSHTEQREGESSDPRVCRGSKLWVPESGRKLQSLLYDKMNDSDSEELIAAWLSIGAEMSGCMRSLTAATRGCSSTAAGDNEDLRCLHEDLWHIARRSTDPADCLEQLRHEFGDVC